MYFLINVSKTIACYKFKDVTFEYGGRGEEFVRCVIYIVT